MLAAACLYALDHHVERLAEDHANARCWPRGSPSSGVRGRSRSETNIVIASVEDPRWPDRRAGGRGRADQLGRARDASAASPTWTWTAPGVDEALGAFGRVLSRA